MLDSEPFRFFRRHIKNAFAFRAQRHFDRRRDALANRDARFDLFANRLNRALLPQKTVRQRLVLTHQAKQQMFGLNVRTAVLTRFVACKKYDAPRFFCIAFEHVSSFLPRWPPACPALQGPRSQASPLCEFSEHRVPAREFGRIVPPVSGCAWR